MDFKCVLFTVRKQIYERLYGAFECVCVYEWEREKYRNSELSFLNVAGREPGSKVLQGSCAGLKFWKKS